MFNFNSLYGSFARLEKVRETLLTLRLSRNPFILAIFFS